MSARGRPPLLSSLRWRLSVAISSVVVLCVAVCMVVAVLFLRQALTDRARDDLGHTLDGVSGYMGIQQGEVLGIAELVAADPAVGAAVRSGNLQALDARLSLFSTSLSTNVLDVIDRRGRVLTHVENGPNTQVYGVVGRTWPSVRAALAGQPVTAYDTVLPQRAATAGYALRATVPLYSNSRIIGAVVVGRALDDIFADRIGTAFNSTVNVIAGTVRAGSTLTDANGLSVAGKPEPQGLLARIASGKRTIAQVEEDGQPVLSGLVPLPASEGPPVAAVEVVSRLDRLYNVATQLSMLILALGAGVVVVGMALALTISRRLTGRLLELEAAAAHVAALSGSASLQGEEGRGDDLHAAVAVRGHDEVASLARSFKAMMQALDERMEANERLYAAAQARVRDLTGLAEVARLLTAASSLQETLDELATHVCRLLDTSAAAIVLHGEGPAPNVYGGAGLPEGYAAITNASLATADSGFQTTPEMALRSGKVSWRRIADIPDSHAAMRAFAQSAGWGATFAVPLRIQDRTIGALACYTAADAPPSASDVSLLTTIADQVAVVVENARLQAQARELAAVEERQRLARELHDSVSQALYGIALGARTARTLLDRDPARVAEPLEYVLALAEAGLVEMRALIFELRPEALASEGLVAALEKQVAFVQARHGIAVSAETGEEPAAPYPVKEALYRIAQEALHNTVKHARARRVQLRLAGSASGLALDVCDDGVGFDTDGSFPGHLGLRTMRERATQLGGTLHVESAPDSGTHIRAEIPCENAG